MSQIIDPIAARMRRLNIAGFAVTAGLILGGGAFATLSTIDSAVIASGRVSVEGNAKAVQHQEGGIVADVLVRNGARVSEGDLLVRLSDVEARASLAIAAAETFGLEARLARLDAESAGADAFIVPGELRSQADEAAMLAAFAAERRLFDARRAEQEAVLAGLVERHHQLLEEIKGLEAQHEALSRQKSLSETELANLQPLVWKGLVTRPRTLALERSIAGAQGQMGAVEAAIAKARSEIASLAIRQRQMEGDRQAAIAAERRTALIELSQAIERQRAAQDHLARTEIRAPAAGTVHELAVHTIGGVVAAGATLLSVIPSGDRLVVEARVEPSDIDRVSAHASARLQIRAANQRLLTPVEGRVIHVASDTSLDPASGRAYYDVRIAVETWPDGTSLVAGMPVDAFIAEGDGRSPLSYLLQPLTEQIAFAWRER